MEPQKSAIFHENKTDLSLILIFFVVPLIIMRYYDVTIVFFNNDDVFLSELVSGITTGRPESHLVHISYILGLFLSRLYLISSSVPWYGIFLFFISYVSIIYAFSILILRVKKIWQKVLFMIAAWHIILFFFFFHLTELQFTTVTMIVCMASFVNFILLGEVESYKEMVKKGIVGFVFFFLSLSIRFEACIMVLPFFITLAIVRIVSNAKIFKYYLAYFGIIFALVITIFITNKVAYLQQPWAETVRFSSSRSQVVDYLGYPRYDLSKGMYDELGIEEQSYISMTSRYQILLDENIDADMYEQIIERIGDRQVLELKEGVQYFVNRHLKDTLDRPLNIIVFFMYIFIVVLTLLSQKYTVLYDIMALVCGRMVLWIYLIYIGRVMQRVTQGIYIVELMALLSVLVAKCLWEGKKKTKVGLKIVAALVTVAIFAICFKWGAPYSQKIYYYNQSQMLYATCYREMREYYNCHPENVYLGDTLSFSYFNKDVFADEYPSVGNFVIMGSWTANTEWTDYIAKRYEIDSYEEAAIVQDNVYFVCMNSAETPWQYLADYYAEKYPGSVMEVEEVVETTFGQDFLILKVRQE